MHVYRILVAFFHSVLCVDSSVDGILQQLPSLQSNVLTSNYCAMLRRARLCHSMSSVRLSVTFRYGDRI